MAFLIFILFVSVTCIVLILFVSLFNKIKNELKQNENKSKRHRRTAFAMLTSRVFVPLVLGFLPVIILTGLLTFDIALKFSTTCILLISAISHGAFNTISTLLIFNPYRKGIIKLTINNLPGFITKKIKYKLNSS